MSALEGPSLQVTKRAIIDRYARTSDLKGFVQLLPTLLVIGLCWTVIASCPRSWAAITLSTAIITVLLVRAFALMHECGHGTLFRNPTLNHVAGFILGVLAGMPQRVWAAHHNHHHATNGDWEKYRGPLAILSVAEYDALTPRRQRAYVRMRWLCMAPVIGFLYLIANPRITWIRATFAFAYWMVRGRHSPPKGSMETHGRGFQTRYCASAREYAHMTLNNVVLLGLWALMCWWVGPALFFPIYAFSVSFAGAAGIILFAIQHNFEHSYASASLQWDIDEGALKGTSYLVLPRWMHWLTANMGYHHVHHLSARIPGYRLAECHEEYGELFADVTRLKISDIRRSLTFLLWDAEARRLISVPEHETALAAAR